ncbi:MAG: YqgE/AlgH family protein [Woeseiaceae bacterium]|nr:YqgE/AlgH family protein [Woeseiaceae bacterium]
MGFEGSMANQLLIAMPGMADPNFSTTVTLICEHNDEGALGIVINRPLELKLEGLFEQLDLDNPDPEAAELPVLMGGPVGPERGFVLHGPVSHYENTLAVSDDIHLTLSRDVIDAMAAGSGPEKTLVALGYAGWDAGQLEGEMLANSWLTVPATTEVVFDMPFDQRWMSAARTLGIDISQISTDAGHA